jgi:sulfoxide reductase heme-binding subunit YedZ
MTSDTFLKKIFKPAFFISSLLPLFWLIWKVLTDGLGANPVEKAIHRTGDWTLNFLMITLSLTPLRNITGWAWLSRLRRMTGLFAFLYASLHFLTYAGFDYLFSLESIIKDAVKHKRIFVGFGTFIILLTLALTSPDKMVRRIGAKRWRAIHRLTYLAAIGGVIHYLWLVKIDIRLPLVYAGILALLLGCRIFLSAARKLKHRH